MGWNETGKFGIHSGKTLRRYPTRKTTGIHGIMRGHVPKRENEFAVVKELRYEREPPFGPKAVNFAVDDGGLPLEKDSLIYSLNKRKRWLLPELLKEKVAGLFYEENTEPILNGDKENKSKKAKKEREQNADAKLRVNVVERHVSAETTRFQPDCIGVTSNAPYTKPNPERKPFKKHSHVGDLKPKASADEVEVYYEFLSPFPKATWPSNRQFRGSNFRDSRDEVVGSKSKKKGKGNRNKWYLHGGQSDELLEEYDKQSLDDYNYDVLQEDSSEPLNTEFSFPIGAYISNAIEAKINKDTAEVDVETKERPSGTVYGKGQVVYIDNDDDVSSFDEIHERDGNESSKYLPLTKDKKFNINLLAEDISHDSLHENFGSNYIEGNASPRKFMIKVDLNEACANNDLDDLCLLFDISDTSKHPDIFESTVGFFLPKTELIPSNLNDILESELNRFQNGGTLTVKSIVQALIEKVAPEINNTPKIISSKKSNTKVPVAFIQNVSKQTSKVYDFKKAVQYALESQEKMPMTPPVLFDSGNNGIRKLFCEICYVEEDMEQCTVTDQFSFTQLCSCCHQFCNDCLLLYIVSCVKAGHSSITCPCLNCKTTINEPLVWSCTNSEIYQLYTKITFQNLVNTNPHLKHCPGVDCTRLACLVGLDENQPISVPISCQCGLVWCFSCQNLAHWPASCEEMDTFCKEFKAHEEYVQMLSLPGSISSVHVKKCPVCCNPIEKSYGCNHMMCSCGQEFCWDCLVPWELHDWGSCEAEFEPLEEVELTINYSTKRSEKYCKIAVRHGLERHGKKYLVFKNLVERAKRVENAHEFVSDDPSTSTGKFVKNCIEKNVALAVEDTFRFKNLADFVLENTAKYIAITKTTKMVKSLSRKMDVLQFIVRRCIEVLFKPAVLLKEGRLETVRELLKRGEEVIWIIDGLVKANRKH